MSSIARAVALGVFLLAGCRASSHPTQLSALGRGASSDELLAVLTATTSLTLESVASADWQVPRSGLINLEHPKAIDAGLTDGDEPIQVYFHAIRHPKHGLFIVDTGMEKALRDDPKKSAIKGLVSLFVSPDKLKVGAPFGPWLEAQPDKLAGVFLTHLHVDHISGMPDVPKGTPIYSGPGETTDGKLENLVVQPVLDRQLAGQVAISEWTFGPDPGGRFAGVLDVFGDKTVWALFVPGHTPGSTAYLVRTNKGPVLMTGDACHTRWGWEHGVEPGTFSSDRPVSRLSLERLEKLVAEHPNIQVRLGHQPISSTIE